MRRTGGAPHWRSRSRSSLMTGRRPDATQVWDLKTHFRTALPDVVTLPGLFTKNGYYTVSLSKLYHPGFEDKLSWSEPHWEPRLKANADTESSWETNAPKVVKHEAYQISDKADDELPDGRTLAQVVVGQAEFADLVVLDHPEPVTLAVLRRLAPRARITVGRTRVELALAHLDDDSRRGRSDHPHAPLLAGLPPLAADGAVGIVEFSARRPFHPERLHAAVDLLLDGVVRTRGRLWLANRDDQVMWLESAGGGLRVASAGKWLAAMTASEVAYVDPERRAFADLMWEHRFGDRHTSMTVLVCGAEPAELVDALNGALLTDDEMACPRSWSGYDDPFGDWHEDPCHETPDMAGEFTAHRSDGEAR